MNLEQSATFRGFLLGVGLVVLGAACQRFLAENPHRTWPLTHSHAEVVCEGCHPTEQGIGPVSSECISCHLAVLPAEHYTEDCGSCHLPTYWRDSSLYHSFLPLEDAHALDCGACHEPGDYRDLPGQSNRCASCHKPDRPREHWPNDCGDCHIPTFWLDATVYHDFLPLDDSHDLPCDSCHLSDDFSALEGQSDQCASCHEEARPQGHFLPAMCDFSTDCVACHGASSWRDGELPSHRDCSTFPKGHESANACEDCHLAAPNYSTFSCLDCHAHRQSAMDDKHIGEVGGYQYESEACLGCHPRGDD